MYTTKRGSRRGEVLVGIMNNQRDFAILREQGWYRIPVDTAPKRWPPEWLAFYQTKAFDDERWTIRYYGRVADIEVRSRRDLFPGEPPNPKSEKRYYQMFLDRLEELPCPIRSDRGRRIVFIPTTWRKLAEAREINDLFDESPLEDRLWDEFKRQRIPAERQWHLPVGEVWYRLDFAVFCSKGQIDIEVDSVTFHHNPARWAKDKQRDTRVQAAGWRVLRFTGREVREELADYCLPEIAKLINRLGGPVDESLVPRTFHETPDGLAQQLALFEGSEECDAH